MGHERLAVEQLRLMPLVVACPDDLRRLWQRVVLQVMMDATSTYPRDRTDLFLAQREARSWLEADSRDFWEVCILAGVDGAALRRWWQQRPEYEARRHV